MRHTLQPTNIIRKIMSQPRNEFTNVTQLQAEAFGEPGNRTFRMYADSASSSASVWLEKEDLFQLALAIHQIVNSIPDEKLSLAGPPTEREAPGLTSLDFKAMNLALGHDPRRGLFVIDAYTADDGEDPTIRIWLDKRQMLDFSEEAMRVCAAGRPLCPLCGRPIDPDGHRCARLNGHAKLTPEDLSEDTDSE